MAQNVTGKLYESITGQLFEIGRQLRQRGGYPFVAEALQKHLQLAVEGRFLTALDVAKETIVRLISGDQILTIDAVDGTEILADAKDLFSYIDSDFINYNANEKGPATPETSVGVYELTQNATFSQMFGELNKDIKKLCLTQHQIKNFVKKYRKWLRAEGYGTFFLFESKGNFFVADARFDSRGDLSVYVDNLGDFAVGDADVRHRLVVPQLAIQNFVF